MEWIFNSMWVYHIPTKPISRDNYMYLWMADDYEYHLAIEDNELRIYGYDYWSEDTIMNNHAWEDWWGLLNLYFEWMYDCFAIDTIRYMTLDIEWKEISDIAKLIVSWADTYMTTDVNWYLVENDDRGSKVPSMGLIKFVKRALEKVGQKVYCYYK